MTLYHSKTLRHVIKHIRKRDYYYRLKVYAVGYFIYLETNKSVELFTFIFCLFDCK